MIVAVLAGGLASRMGRPKAAVTLRGRPLIDYPLAAAREAGLAAVVLAKQTSELPALTVEILHEPAHPRHPLCGIVTALRHARTPVLAVGCDMPFVNAALLRRLAGRAGPGRAGGSAAAGPRATHAPGARTTSMRVDGRLQPLPALYRPDDLDVLERALQAQAPLRATLERLAPLVLEEATLRELGDPRRLCFSVNDARDLRKAARWTQG